MCMIRYFICIIFILSLRVDATTPAMMFEISPQNIVALGFELDVEKIGEQSYVRLSVPSVIEDNWIPVTTQSFTYNDDDAGALTKVELGNPTNKISLNVYYYPEREDLMVGVYFICKLSTDPCRGDWDSRLYSVESVNNFLITKQSTGRR